MKARREPRIKPIPLTVLHDKYDHQLSLDDLEEFDNTDEELSHLSDTYPPIRDQYNV